MGRFEILEAGSRTKTTPEQRSLRLWFVGVAKLERGASAESQQFAETARELREAEPAGEQDRVSPLHLQARSLKPPSP